MKKITVTSTLKSPLIRFNKRLYDLRVIQNSEFKKLCLTHGIDIEFQDFGPEFTDELYEIWDFGIDNGLISK